MVALLALLVNSRSIGNVYTDCALVAALAGHRFDAAGSRKDPSGGVKAQTASACSSSPGLRITQVP
eukprot:12277666-Prorocentrum_lima.AAC.1